MENTTSNQEKIRLNLAFGLVCFAALFPVLTQAGLWIPANLSLVLKIICGLLLTQGSLFLAEILPFPLTNTPFVRVPDILGLKKLTKEELKRLGRIVFPVFILVTLTSSLLSLLAKFMGAAQPSQQIVQMMMNAPWPVFFTIAFSAVLIAPVIEEIAFRRILYSWFLKNLTPVAAITVVSLFFAMIHTTLWQIPSLFLLAVIFQLEYIRSGGKTTYTILMHAAFNGLTVLATLALRLYQTV